MFIRDSPLTRTPNKTAIYYSLYFFFQADDGIRALLVTGVPTCALPILVGAKLRLERYVFQQLQPLFQLDLSVLLPEEPRVVEAGAQDALVAVADDARAILVQVHHR